MTIDHRQADLEHVVDNPRTALTRAHLAAIGAKYKLYYAEKIGMFDHAENDDELNEQLDMLKMTLEKEMEDTEKAYITLWES